MKYFILILITGTLSIFSCKNKNAGGEILPAFDLLLLDSTTHLNTSAIKEGQPIALLYFSPDCEHCQEETMGILHHIDSLKNVQFYFVTNDPFDRLKAFNTGYGLNRFSNITLGRDEQFFIIRHFKKIFPPYLVIYDSNKHQRGIFSGTTDASKIIAFVNNL